MERIKTEVKMELMSEPVLTTTTSTASAEALSFLRNGDKRIESGEGFSCFKFCCRSIWISLFSCPDPQKGGGGKGGQHNFLTAFSLAKILNLHLEIHTLAGNSKKSLFCKKSQSFDKSLLFLSFKFRTFYF